MGGYKDSNSPPFQCPKCKKMFKSYSGVDYHMKNVCKPNKTLSITPSTPGTPGTLKITYTPKTSNRKRQKSLKKKKYIRKQPLSPIQSAPTIETLTWAEAQRMEVINENNQQYRLDIEKEIPIMWVDDEDSQDTVSMSVDEPATIEETADTAASINEDNPNDKEGSTTSVTATPLENMVVEVPEINNLQVATPAENSTVVTVKKPVPEVSSAELTIMR